DPSKRVPAGDSWTIDDQCLKAMAHPRIGEDLVSAGKYRDFELRFEWRISVGGNSGLKYGIQKRVFMENKTFEKGMP
ncbi:DUF1080 domain-containing protein, partial [Bacillus atrophaeus]|uniref:family 16 glycoside hydrolase n=1 Tax=Bacillus atrophaeus TaxID=1452 RepID=UPI001EFB1D9A